MKTVKYLKDKWAILLALGFVSAAFVIPVSGVSCYMAGEWPCRWEAAMLDCVGNEVDSCRCTLVVCKEEL